MKRLVLLILIIFFSVPNLIYAQEFDFSKPTKNTEQTTKSIEKELEINKQKAKKEKKEKKRLNRLTGNIISLGFGCNNYLTNRETNIRFHHLLKNINLGFYISPIVINTTSFSIYKNVENYHEKVEHEDILDPGGYWQGSNSWIEKNNTSDLAEDEDQSGSQLGSIQFGASTTILFNRVTISTGSALSINKIAPVKTLEVGVMLHLTEKINVEYKYSTLKTKQEFNGINPKFHMFSIGYRIFKSN